MTGKGTKRLLSLLLSVLLVVGMLPMGALAANAPTGDDYVEVTLRAGHADAFEASGKTSISAYVASLKGSYSRDAEDKETAYKNIEVINNVFEPGTATADADIEVSQGGSFYVAVGFDTTHLTGATSGLKGVGGRKNGSMSINLAYDGDVFTKAAGYTHLATQPASNRIIDKDMYSGDLIADKLSCDYTVGIGTAAALTATGYTKGDGFGAGLPLQATAVSEASYLAPLAEWVWMVKFTVADTATPGVYKFAYPETDSKTNIAMLKCEDGKTGSTVSDATSITPGVNQEYLKTTDLRVKVKEKPAPGITLKGVAGESTITVGANDYCKLGATASPSHWTVKSGTTDGASGTVVTVSSATAGNGKVTLTLADPLVADTDYYVEAAAAAFAADPAVSAPVKNTFRAGVKPAATYSIDTDGKVILSNATGCEYRVGTSGNFSPVSSTAFPIADTTNTSNPSATVQVQKTGNTDATLIQSITIDRADVPGNYTINYTGETLKFAGNVQYKIGTTGSVESGSTAEKTITPGAAAQSFTYWTAPVIGANGKLKSAIKSGSIPKRPDNNAALGTTSDTQKENGKTVLGTAAAGTKYFIDTANDTTTVPGSGVENWAAGAIDATTAKWIHAYIPATATAFKSEFKHLQGVGFDYGTVTASGASEGTTITLNIVGADWAAGVAAGNFHLDKGLTVASINRDSDSQVTLTLDDNQKLADGTYTITVDNAATTKNAAINQHITSGKVSLNILSSGWKLAIGETNSEGTLTLGGSFAGGSEAEITVNGLKDYEALDTVTAAGMTCTLVEGSNKFKINGAAPANPGDRLEINITVKPNVKEVTLGFTPDGNKAYDGTTALKAGTTVEVTNKYADKTDVTVSGIVYSSAAAETTTFDLSNAVLGGEHAKYYKLNKETVTLTGKINKATFGSVTVTPIDDTKGTTNDAIVAAINGSPVTVITGESAELPEGLTFFDVFGDNLDGELADLIEEALIGNNKFLSDVVSADVSGVANGDNLGITAKKGDTIKITIPADADKDSLNVTFANGTGYSVEGAVVTIAKDAADGEETITIAYDDKDGSPVSVTVKVTPTAAKADYDNADGENLSITIPNTYDYSKLNPTFAANFSDPITASNIALNVTVKKVATPPPAGGFGVTFNTRDYGEADSTYAQADSEGKITALPKMNKVVKGAQFNGWSKDGTEAGKVDIGTLVVDDNIELFAWFEGYMNGYGYAAKRPVKPTASVTRGELLKMLLVASGEYDGEKSYTGTTKFTDGNGQWYTPYLICAEQSGKTIIEGYGDGTFRANRPVTRYEAAKMIAGAFGVDVDPNGTASELKDFANIPDWAKEFVAALYNNGTVDGRNDGAYHGDDNIQRCEAAKMINIYLGLDDASKDAITQSTQIENPFTDISKSNWAYAEVMFASLSVPASYYSYDLTMPSGR